MEISIYTLIAATLPILILAFIGGMISAQIKLRRARRELKVVMMKTENGSLKSRSSMLYRELPNGKSISVLGMGCAAIGQDYPPGTKGLYGSEAIELILAAREAGVNVFDTSPYYGDGESERLLFEALGDDENIHILTKYDPLNPSTVSESMHRLHRVPFFIQAKLDSARAQSILCRMDGSRAHIQNNDGEYEVELPVGITIYEEFEVFAAVCLDLIHAIQVPFNLNDQRFTFAFQYRDDLAIFGRSALLRGTIHDDQLALRFALFGFTDNLCPHSMFVGFKSIAELNRALKALDAGRLDKHRLIGIRDSELHPIQDVDPREWDKCRVPS